MRFFDTVEGAPLDAILGLNIMFAADNRTNKVDLGAGVYKTADRKPLILKSVKKAEDWLVENEMSKDYLPIDGLPDYVNLTKELVFGKNDPHIYGAQTVGGTASLRLAASFLKERGLSTIYIPNPTWPNHERIFQHAGLIVKNYPYYDKKTKNFDYAGLFEALDQMPERSIVCLQVCCHNPTGLDPDSDQWIEMCNLIKRRGLFPFFDFAYQGFGEGIVEDRKALEPFLNHDLEFAVSVSHAKNFSLYAERCGCLFFACHTAQEAKNVGSQLKLIIRGMYSNPPCHGARIVTTILQDEALTALWEKELQHMRERISGMRSLAVKKLQERLGSTFDFLSVQKGMFSYTGLSETQVEQLISLYAIYLPIDGRINVAGLNEANIDYVTGAISDVSRL